MDLSQPESPRYGFRCPPSSIWKGEPVLQPPTSEPSHTQIIRTPQLHSGNTGAPRRPRNARVNGVHRQRYPTPSGSKLTAEIIESYNKKHAKVCGTFGMIAGLVCSSLNVALIALNNSPHIYYINKSGSGVWGGAVFFIAGLLQFISGFKTNKNTVLATYVSSIIAIAVYLPVLVLTLMNLSGTSEEHKPRRQHFEDKNSSSSSSDASLTLMPLSVAIVVVASLELVPASFACYLSDFFCCKISTSNGPSSNYRGGISVVPGMHFSPYGGFGHPYHTSGGGIACHGGGFSGGYCGGGGGGDCGGGGGGDCGGGGIC